MRGGGGMALAAPRGSSRSLPAPARLLPAPLSGPPRPQPPPPGRSAAGRGAGSGGRSRSGPRPSQRTLGERPRAGPGGEERWRGPCAPTPSKQPPPGLPRLAGMRRGCSESFRAGGVQAAPGPTRGPCLSSAVGLVSHTDGG